eukprot:4473223-Prymnesium_polylepis.1
MTPTSATSVCCAVGVVIGVQVFVRGWLWRRAVAASYEALARQKRVHCAESLKRAQAAGCALTWRRLVEEWGPKSRVPPSEVVQLTATALLDAMARGDISSEYATRCFIARAIEVDGRCRCVTEQDYERAIADAARCDTERARGELRGRLHGLPISVKEQIEMAGFDSTCGACCRLFRPAEADAVVVAVLRRAGAIPFVRTNVPQLLMLPESFNSIYGTTCNPFDLSRTAGGSTGGEAALISARGSPLGIGSDVGGSIRIPAVMTGITGFKPTVERLSAKGMAVPRLNNRNGQKEVRSTAGPMARSVGDLELAMDVWCREAMYALDVSIPPVPWDHAAYTATSGRKLRFGFFVDDGWWTPAPSHARA